jgi:hypothetical protein
MPVQGSADNPRHTSEHNNHAELDQFAILARVFEPYAAQAPPSHSPTSRMPAPLYSIPSGASGASDPTMLSVDEGEQSGSYGTLMLSKGGRSKYLGPTAGSEWLKDVCRLA